MVAEENFFDEISEYKDDELRDYQKSHKLSIYGKWKSVNSVLLQMPTGTGKTRLFVSIINDFQNYAEKHNTNTHILVITHRNELVDQITKELGNYGLNCSLIDAEHKYSHYSPKDICVASIQTLSRRMYYWARHPFDLVIIDEAHHARSKSYRRVLDNWKDSKILGVTATPYRMNGDGLVHEFEELIISPSIKQFIEAGWLSNYDYYSISEDNDIYRGLSDVKLDSYGDYQINDLWRYCKKDSIRAEIVASYLEYAKGKKGIVYTINKAHNNQLCSEFRRSGIAAYGIDSETKPEERERLVQAFRQGLITILCNVNIFTEGFDCPDVEFIQFARPTRSLGLYLQQVGRGLRISENKEKVIFIDNVGLYNRFGVPSAKRRWGYHFVGKAATDYGRQYAEDMDSYEPFNLHSRNSDLSEGCEKISLIESTGLNEINKTSKQQYADEIVPKLKPIIDSIFSTNRKVYVQYIENYRREPHLSFSAKVFEDLLVPCPIVQVETDDMEYINNAIKDKYKPVVVDGEIEYEEFKDWNDFASFECDYVKKIFKKHLCQSQAESMKRLDAFTVNELRIYFETEYGAKHIMSKKLNEYCLREGGFDTKWETAKKNGYMRCYRKEKRVKDPHWEGHELVSCTYIEQ